MRNKIKPTLTTGSDAAPSRELLAAVELVMRLSTARGVFFHQAIAHRANLNLTDLQCVNILAAEGPFTAGQLAGRVGLTKGGAITAALNRLEKAGFVVRERDPADGRQVLVRHTEEGLRRLEPLMAGFLRRWEAIMSSRSDDELCVLLDYFRNTNDALRLAIMELNAR